MDANQVITTGMSAELTHVVPIEETVGYVIAGMPMVFSTPMMIQQMELTAFETICKSLWPGWVSVGVEVNVRHLAPSFVGDTVRTTSRVIAVERRVIRFEVFSYCGRHKIGEGFHARGLVNTEKFGQRLARETQAVSSS